MITSTSQKGNILPILIFLLLLTLIVTSYYLLNFNKNIQSVSNITPAQNLKLLNLQKQEISNKLKGAVDKEDPTVAINLLKSMLTDNKIAGSCHEYAHVIGREAFIKYQNLDKALSYKDEACGAGYIHGAIEMKFDSTSDIVSTLKTICLPSNSGVCFHGVGHGLMYYSENDLPYSIKYCNQLSTTDSKVSCSEGVFMENFEGDHIIHPTQYISSTDPFYPCEDQTGVYQPTCYFYAPRYYLELNHNKFEQALKWCQTAPKENQVYCATGVGSATVKQNLNTPTVAENVCMTGRSDLINPCLDGVVSYYIVNFRDLKATDSLCDIFEPQNKAQCKLSEKNRHNFF